MHQDNLLEDVGIKILDWFNREVTIKEQNHLLFLKYLHLFHDPELILSSKLEDNAIYNPDQQVQELRELSSPTGDQSFL